MYDQPFPTPPPERQRARFRDLGARIIVRIIAVMVVLAAAGFVFGLFTGRSSKAAPSAQPTVTITAHAPAASASGAAPSPAAASATPASGSQQSIQAPNPNSSGTELLLNLTPASGAFQSQDASPVLNGKAQKFAIDQDLQDYTTSGDLAYNLGRHYLHFTGLLGIDDNSPDGQVAPMIEIEGDGVKLATYTPTLGHPDQISLNVKGILRLDIRWINNESDDSGNVIGTLVLGDGQLTTVPGYVPPPPSSPSD
jgi:hypothetical protein